MPGCGEPWKGLKQESDLIVLCLMKVKNDSGSCRSKIQGAGSRGTTRGASMGFGTRWSGRVAEFQVSASVTSHETQLPAAPLPPEFSPRLPGRTSTLIPLLASGSLPTFRPSARRRVPWAATLGSWYWKTGFSLCSQVPSQTRAGPDSPPLSCVA